VSRFGPAHIEKSHVYSYLINQDFDVKKYIFVEYFNLLNKYTIGRHVILNSRFVASGVNHPYNLLYYTNLGCLIDFGSPFIW
jgi:hypothetical protein